MPVKSSTNSVQRTRGVQTPNPKSKAISKPQTRAQAKRCSLATTTVSSASPEPKSTVKVFEIGASNLATSKLSTFSLSTEASGSVYDPEPAEKDFKHPGDLFLVSNGSASTQTSGLACHSSICDETYDSALGYNIFPSLQREAAPMEDEPSYDPFAHAQQSSQVKAAQLTKNLAWLNK